jgi:hypothetical protein
MSRSKMRMKRRVVAGAVLTLALAGGAAFAAIPSEDGEIWGCYRTPNGMLRIVDEDRACATGETRISWNQAGVPGAPGEPGSPGEPGVAGVSEGWFAQSDGERELPQVIPGEPIDYSNPLVELELPPIEDPAGYYATATMTFTFGWGPPYFGDPAANPTGGGGAEVVCSVGNQSAFGFDLSWGSRTTHTITGWSNYDGVALHCHVNVPPDASGPVVVNGAGAMSVLYVNTVDSLPAN